MILRSRHLERLQYLHDHFPVVAILGARQVGKTTLAMDFARRHPHPVVRFDLEDLDDLARLDEPKLALKDLRGLVIIDEIQRRPELFPVLRVLVDRPEASARFLILGSASPELLQQTSETLAGRIAFHPLDGFSLDEVGMDSSDALWLRGGFPRSFLAPSLTASNDWRKSFIQTFLERDLPQLNVRIPATTLHRFWKMLAHYHGQVWNGSELARAFGVSHATVRRYLDILTAALVIRQLPPWHENIGKRQIKSPKVYLADSGLFHSLLTIETQHDLEGHPKVGASWEGFVIKELVQNLNVAMDECYFWGTYSGAELDLLVIKGQRRYGFEIKRTSAPRITASMRAARDSLKLTRLNVIHAGEHSFPLDNGIQAIAFQRLCTELHSVE